MKTLILYDSNYGNTKLVAETLALEFAPEVECFSVNDVKKIETKPDLIIAGSPINAWRPTPKMSDFLNALKPNQLKGVRCAAFDTRIKIFISGNAAKKIEKKLMKAGAQPVAAPKAFYVKDTEGPLLEDELNRAKTWAKFIKSNY